MFRCLVILLGFLTAVVNALPTVDKNEINHPDSKKIVDFLNPASNEISKLKTIDEPKDLLEFFKEMRAMRTKKSLFIVGKDNKYIYLVVSDNVNSNTDEASVEKRRSKRGIGKFLEDTLDFIGPSGVRHFAVAVGLLNFLGYTPVRVPGIPYHVDSGCPECSYYNYVNTFPHVKRHEYFA